MRSEARQERSDKRCRTREAGQERQDKRGRTRETGGREWFSEERLCSKAAREVGGRTRDGRDNMG